MVISLFVFALETSNTIQVVAREDSRDGVKVGNKAARDKPGGRHKQQLESPKKREEQRQSLLSARSSQLSALSSQLSALSSQLAARSSQLAAPSSQLSALSSQLSAPIFRTSLALCLDPRDFRSTTYTFRPQPGHPRCSGSSLYHKPPFNLPTPPAVCLGRPRSFCLCKQIPVPVFWTGHALLRQHVALLGAL